MTAPAPRPGASCRSACSSLLALLPLGFEQYKLYVASLTLVYLVMAIGLNLTLGYAGQISLAHGAFMAFGSYGVAILGQRGWPFELGLGSRRAGRLRAAASWWDSPRSR